MPSSFDKTAPAAMLLDLAIALGAVAVMNAAIFGLGWRGTGDGLPLPWFSPPEWGMGAIWIVFLGLLALVRWRLNRQTDSAAADARRWLVILGGACLAYPVYALATANLWLALAGNILTIVLAIIAQARVRRVSRRLAWAIFPLVPWLTYTANITFYQLSDPGF